MGCSTSIPCMANKKRLSLIKETPMMNKKMFAILLFTHSMCVLPMTTTHKIVEALSIIKLQPYWQQDIGGMIKHYRCDKPMIEFKNNITEAIQTGKIFFNRCLFTNTPYENVAEFVRVLADEQGCPTVLEFDCRKELDTASKYRMHLLSSLFDHTVRSDSNDSNSLLLHYPKDDSEHVRAMYNIFKVAIQKADETGKPTIVHFHHVDEANGRYHRYLPLHDAMDPYRRDARIVMIHSTEKSLSDLERDFLSRISHGYQFLIEDNNVLSHFRFFVQQYNNNTYINNQVSILLGSVVIGSSAAFLVVLNSYILDKFKTTKDA